MNQQPITVATRSNKLASEYDSGLAYLRDLQSGSLPRSIEECLKIDPELRSHVDLALLYAKPKRGLEFAPKIDPSNFKSFGTTQIWKAIASMLIHLSGVLPHEPCNGEERCQKKFFECIVPDPSLEYGPKFKGSKKTACSNHHYDGESSRCSGPAPAVANSTVAQAPAAVANAFTAPVATANDAQVVGSHPVDQNDSRPQIPGHPPLNTSDGWIYEHDASSASHLIAEEYRTSLESLPHGKNESDPQTFGLETPALPQAAHQRTAFQPAVPQEAARPQVGPSQQAFPTWGFSQQASWQQTPSPFRANRHPALRMGDPMLTDCPSAYYQYQGYISAPAAPPAAMPQQPLEDQQHNNSGTYGVGAGGAMDIDDDDFFNLGDEEFEMEEVGGEALEGYDFQEWTT